MCEVMGCDREAEHLHHVFFHTSKRYRKALDVPENAQLVCVVCHLHTGIANSRKNKEEFKLIQEERGYNINGWISNLPLIIKDW